MRVTARWNGQLLARSERCERVEGNWYFPPEAVDRAFLRPSDTHTTCFWKGRASYYDVVVDGEVNRDAAWYYPSASDRAHDIEGHIAFWKGVEVKPE